MCIKLKQYKRKPKEFGYEACSEFENKTGNQLLFVLKAIVFTTVFCE